jgi:GT2 family glycosyltransferase/spore maturation protein CgeB
VTEDQSPADRVAELEREIAAFREEMAARQDRTSREIDLRADRQRALSEELRGVRKELARAQRQLEALQRRRAVRVAVALADRVRGTRLTRLPLVRSLIGRGASDVPVREPKVPVERHRLRATAEEEAALRADLAARLPTESRQSGPLVSIVVLNRDGESHLRRCLAGLERQAYRDLEVIVVDNGSQDGSLRFLREAKPRFPLRIIANETNWSFSEANDQGAAIAEGELLLFLNNDIEPFDEHAVGRLVETILGEETVAAVGALLIYPRRDGPKEGPVTRAADLTIQHRGIDFTLDEGVPRARHTGRGEDPRDESVVTAREVPASTAACLLVRRDRFEAAGGFDLAYNYGSEDIDLCLKLRAAGGTILYDGRSVFWHHESATQYHEDTVARHARQDRNRQILLDRWTPRLFREVFRDKLAGDGRWSADPLHVGITVTRDDPAAGFGDWYTAHELGDALTAIGWRVSYLERHEDRWYEPDPSIEVVVALLDAFDLQRLPAHLITVAWIRNWTDRWLDQPSFNEYDIVLASSRRSVELIEERSSHVAHLFPLATNPERFGRASGHEPDASDGSDGEVVFAGNSWGPDRSMVAALAEIAKTQPVAVYGRGWEEVASVSPYLRGHVGYELLPDIYAGALVVLDDAAISAKPYGAVNSRVFDALAAGALVVSNDPAGLHALFDEDFPAVEDPTELAALVDGLARDADRRRSLADRYRAQVLERHTYARRAVELRDILGGWATALRVDVLAGVPKWEEAQAWGDYHFGRAIQRSLEQHGHPTQVRLLTEWTARHAARADVVVHLFGLSEALTRSGQVSVLWVISHPDLLTDEMLARYDVIFVASDSFAAELAKRTDRTVVPLHQATDPARFRPTPGGPAHDLLFVANSRGVRRRIIDELTPTSHDLAVFGKGWTPDLLDPRHLAGEWIPNDQLPAYYSAAAIVLNDTWPDMAAQGFLSNRLYDAAASGAFVISDEVAGLEAEFDGGVVAYRDAADLRGLIERFLGDPDARRVHADRARAAVLARHSFDHRVEELLRAIDPLHADHPPFVES